MLRSFATTSLLSALLLATGVGAIDAALEGSWDHLAMFAVAAVLALALLAGFVVGHPAVPLRRDLMRWAVRRSQLTGEPVEQLIDRAVSGYRALLDVPETTSPASPAERVTS